MSYVQNSAPGGLVEKQAFDTGVPFDSTAAPVLLEDSRSHKVQERNHVVPIHRAVASLASKERGASMVEYALLLVLIAIVAFVAVRLAGQSVSSAFSTVANGFTNPN